MSSRHSQMSLKVGAFAFVVFMIANVTLGGCPFPCFEVHSKPEWPKRQAYVGSQGNPTVFGLTSSKPTERLGLNHQALLANLLAAAMVSSLAMLYVRGRGRRLNFLEEDNPWASTSEIVTRASKAGHQIMGKPLALVPARRPSDRRGFTR